MHLLKVGKSAHSAVVPTTRAYAVFTTILVAIDGEAAAGGALPTGGRCAYSTDSHIHNIDHP